MNIAVMPVIYGPPFVPSTRVACQVCGQICWVSKLAKATLADRYFCIQCVMDDAEGLPPGEEKIMVPAEWVRADLEQLAGRTD